VIDHSPDQRLDASLLRLQYRIASALKAAASTEQTLLRVLDALIDLDGIDCGGVYTFERSGELVLQVHIGLPEWFVADATRYAADSPHVTLAKGGQPVYQSFKDVPPALLSSAVRREALRAIAAIPVSHEGRVVGLLNLASHTHEIIPGDARGLIEAVAAEIGGVIAFMTAEHELRTSQENLQALFASIEEFMFILDDEGRIVHVNPAVERVLGYREEELRGQHVLMVHPPDRRDEAGRIVGEMLAGESTRCPVPLLTRTGAQVPVETRVVRGLWDGKPAIFGVSRDVSERVAAQAALQAERDFGRSVMDAVEQGLTVTDADGYFEYVNPAYARMVGRPAAKIVGRQPKDFTVEDDHVRLAEARAARFKGQATRYETRLRRPDGEIVHGLVTGTPRWKDRPTAGAISAITDLTEHHRQEEQRLGLERQVQDARRRASLGTMAGGIAHHLNNQLTAVIGNLSLSEMPGLPDDTLRLAIIEARQSAERAAELARHMLTYVGYRTRVTRVVTLGPVVSAVLAEFGTGLTPSVRVECHIDDEAVRVALGDDEVRQIVLSLLMNSAEAIGVTAGTIAITVAPAAKATLTPEEAGALAESPASLVVLRVTDTGRGMEREELGRMFDPFYSTKLLGRGLGLAITLGLVETAGGTIAATSALGRGTTVSVLLPVAR
jgi:PAS domain S-box-containing protein